MNLGAMAGRPGLDPAVLALPCERFRGDLRRGFLARAVTLPLAVVGRVIIPRAPQQPFNRDQALTEIQQRNRLRKSASLPLLDIEGELKLEGGGRCL